jgi:hypothetical protein
MNAYEAKVENEPSELNEKQRTKMLDVFMGRSYTMTASCNHKPHSFTCKVKVLDLKKESDTKYRVSMSGSDKGGTSKFDGLLVFKGSGIGFKLFKAYDDK